MKTHPPVLTRVPRGSRRHSRALRLGTRRSLLAVTQSQWVGRQVSGLGARPVELRVSRVDTSRHDYHNTLGKGEAR